MTENELASVDFNCHWNLPKLALASCRSSQIFEPAFECELVLLDSGLVGLVDGGPASCDLGVDVAALLDEVA